WWQTNRDTKRGWLPFGVYQNNPGQLPRYTKSNTRNNESPGERTNGKIIDGKNKNL
ncbi:unnamed protein product, partial [Amoebophrya sp. A120]